MLFLDTFWNNFKKVISKVLENNYFSVLHPDMFNKHTCDTKSCCSTYKGLNKSFEDK